MVNQTQMYSSSISPLERFQGIICNIERLKGGHWGPELLKGPDLKGGRQTSLHTAACNCSKLTIETQEQGLKYVQS